jgi:hypothetical protein
MRTRANVVRSLLFSVPLVLLVHGVAHAQLYDEIELKNGSHIVGEIQSMTGGTLIVKTVFGGELKIDWKEVKSLKNAKAMPFVLKDNTSVNGLAQGAGEDSLDIKAESLTQAQTVPMTAITAINPPVKPPVAYKGNLSLGATLSDGNTRNRTLSTLGMLEARSERLRLTLNANYNYADDDSGVTAQNGRGSAKFDFFLTKRFYLFVSSLFEHDGLADLNLRTALSAGPGYQFIDKNDFQAEYLKEMTLYGEVGIAYFDEDYRTGLDLSVPPPRPRNQDVDKSYIAGRWAINFDWPIVPKQVFIFHNHEGYPSLEKASDLYITTQQGVRFTIWNGLAATFQINWRWDNTPAPGFNRSDTQYIAALGYNFDF